MGFVETIDSFAESFHKETVFNYSTQNTAGSALGGWINLILLANVLEDSLTVMEKQKFEQLLKCSIQEGLQYLTQLVKERPDAIALALGLWFDDERSSQGVVNLSSLLYSVDLNATAKTRLPSKDELNDWVEKNTLGIIRELNLEEDPERVALLVNAIATKIKWFEAYSKTTEEDTNNKWGVRSLLYDEKAEFTVGLTDSNETVFVQRKVGYITSSEETLYGVHETPVGKPVVVYTAHGTPDVKPEELYNYILKTHRNSGYYLPAPSKQEVEEMLATKPHFITSGVETVYGGPEVVANVQLPAWQAHTDKTLDNVVGYDIASDKWLKVFDETLTTKQVVFTKYDRVGYEAAAVTVTMMRATGMPAPQEALILNVRYENPFVSVAFVGKQHGASSVWDDVPLFTNVVCNASEVSQ